jgi:glycosyltransferase involved in cell wall biosynthesis
MRILHAVRSDGFAGVERHVADLARTQAADGHEVLVVGGDPAAVRRVLGPDVAHRPARRTADVARALATWGPGCDVVHVHMTAAEVAATLAAALRPALRRVPVVSTRHFAGPRGSGRLGPAVAAVARRQVAAQVAISRYVAAHVDGAATVVHPGVADGPTEVAAAADREAVVLVVQRHEPEKDGDVALRAFAASGLAAQGWRLELAGAGSQTEMLRDLAAELGIGATTRFLGHRDDVPALMDRAALLLAPCRIEGLGLSVLEAMAAGLPGVVSAAGGHLETVGALDAPELLFPAGDAEAAGARLARLAHDPARRDELAVAGRRLQQKHFSPRAHAAGTEQVYREVLARRAVEVA